MPFLTASPRVVGRLRADFYDLRSLLASPHFAGRRGEALVLALYEYFTSPLDGTYHFWSADETGGHPRTRINVAESEKYLNAYGWMICGNVSVFLYALYTTAGYRARMIGIPGHALCEVYYEGRWHILDFDMWTWFRTPEGHLASAWELARDPRRLILENPRRSQPCDLPDRSLSDYCAMYEQTPRVDDEERVREIRPPCLRGGHSMDFVLRPGETLLRSEVAAGRFVMGPSWAKLVDKTPSYWHGGPRERYAPFRTYGNGQWRYEPRLEAASADLDLGVWERSGLTQDAQGLRGPGWASFRIQSPYPFCGVPEWDASGIRHRDGVWLQAAGEGALRVEVTDAEGAWSEVARTRGAFDERWDITQLFAARYDGLLRFTLEPGASLRSLGFLGYIMTAPISLPRLAPGANPMQLRCLDRHHLATCPWLERIDFREQAVLQTQALAIRNGRAEPYLPGWQQLAPLAPGQPVEAVYAFAAPAGRSFAWAYLLVTLREGPPEEPQRSGLLEWSLEGLSWWPLAGTRIANTQMRWDVTLDGEVLFDQPAPKVFLRITSGTPIAGVECFGHLSVPAGPQRLRIEHRWVDESGERTFTVPEGAQEYEIHCAQNPRAHAIEMRAESVRKPT